MKFSHVLMAFAVTLVSAGPICAQPITLPGMEPQRKYVTFDIDPDFPEMLKSRLQMEKQLGPLKDLIREIAKDPSKFKMDAGQRKEFSLDNEENKKALQFLLASDPELQDALRESIKQKVTGEEAEKAKEELKKFLDDQGQQPSERGGQNPSDAAHGHEPEKAEGDSFGKLTERAMKQAENTRLGDWLRESPAWNRAFADLHKSMNDPDGRGKLGAWEDKVRAFDGGPWKLGEDAFERLKELPRPKLTGLKVSMPGFKNVPAPNLSMPGMPDFGSRSVPSLGTAAIWLLLVLFFLLAGWQAWRWSKSRIQAARELARLGPWPVRPEAVATRAELIRAFDYLALLTLGLSVQSWNHRAVARRWSEQSPPCAEQAEALALLYEQARYTAGAAELTESQRDVARLALCQLREAL